MRIVFFTGKGGVGKTTSAAATALRLADRGVKTLLISTDAAHSLADALAVHLGDDPREVAPGLSAVQLDGQARFERSWREVQRYLLDLMAAGGADPIMAEELTILPGVEEVLALLAVRELVEDGRWDAVVVDCAPTAETLRLLALPEALSWYLAKALPMQRRLARGVRPMAALLGAGNALPPDSVFEALLRLREEVGSVRELLADPAVSSVRLVLTPESMVVAEARRTLTALALYGYRVDGVVANRVIRAGDDWRSGWAATHAAVLIEVQSSFAPAPVLTVDYRPDEPVGTAALRDFADNLYGLLPGVDPIEEVAVAPAMSVLVDGDDYVLRLPLPFTERADVQAARSGDDLVISVGAHRRVLALPSVLRRCVVVSGGFADHTVSVRFRPDPSKWPVSS
jgi:arsenite-transporting ATPase